MKPTAVNILSDRSRSSVHGAQSAKTANQSEAAQKESPRKWVQSFPYFLGVNSIVGWCHMESPLSTQSRHKPRCVLPGPAERTSVVAPLRRPYLPAMHAVPLNTDVALGV